jgi:mannose-6-phosphate isomerase-like protein (cupin superfamily)
MKHPDDHNQPLILMPGEGRVYHLGPMTAIFKADENETNSAYSISEWWIDPMSEGPAPHQHEDKDQVFYVLEGTINVLVEEKWIEADRGSFIRIPRNTMHTFANRTESKAAMLNIDIPGGFERDLPAMAQWFKENK